MGSTLASRLSLLGVVSAVVATLLLAGGLDRHGRRAPLRQSQPDSRTARLPTRSPTRIAPAAGDDGAARQALALQRVVDSEYAVRPLPNGAGLRAINRAQNLAARFDRSGVELRARLGEDEPIRIAGTRLVRGDDAGEQPSSAEPELPALGACRADGALDLDGTCLRRVEVARGAVTEIWENRPDGIEHGFIVQRAPAGDGELAMHVRIDGASVEVEDDGLSASLVRPGLGRALRYAGLRAFDADGADLPAFMRAEDGGVALVIDDRAARYPIAIDPVLSSAASWTMESNQSEALFGSAVASAGDFNGDGFGDLIIGAPKYDGSAVDEGAVFIVFGSASGVTPPQPAVFYGGFAGAAAGTAVALAGDVNKDGYDDVVVGAPHLTSRGSALVYFGNSAGVLGTLAVLSTGAAGDEFGSAVAGAGDVNCDGYGDVIIGAGKRSNGQTSEGGAFLYYGSASGISSTPAWSREGDVANLRFGAAVAGAGDVDADGCSDVIVGAPGLSNGQSKEGAAYVYRGSPSGSLSLFWTKEGDVADGYFGSSVATAGDVDGSGTADVLVGAPGLGTPTSTGHAYLFLGRTTGVDSSPVWSAPGIGPNGIGTVVGSAGDVNGDGYADVLIATVNYPSSGGSPSYGAAWLYLGGATGGTGLQTSAAWVHINLDPTLAYAASAATAGDFNGDGFADIVIGAPNYGSGQTHEGEALVHFGAPLGIGYTAVTRESDQAGANEGFAVSSAGDVNGDGFGDIVVGAPGYDEVSGDEGRAIVFFGSQSDLVFTPVILKGTQANALFGSSVSATDFNCDGFTDVIVGEPGYTNTKTNEGRASVYYGAASSPLSATPFRWYGQQPGAWFGYSVAGANDINGDGCGDIIMGSPGYDNGQVNEGVAFVAYGGSTPSSEANWYIESNTPGAQLGTSVASARDYNRDGLDDVLVGAPYFKSSSAELDEGAAYLYLGSTTTPASASGWPIEGNQAGAHFGMSVAGAGDVNGDGYDDVLVGAPSYTHGQTHEGIANLYSGTAATFTPGTHPPARIIERDLASEGFGTSVASAGDVNGDGYGDIVIAGPNYANGESGEGRALVYLGGSIGLQTSPSWTVETNTVNAGLTAVASAGDVNGDGFSDVLVGAPGFSNPQTGEGRAFLYFANAQDGAKGARPTKARTLRAFNSPISPGGTAQWTYSVSMLPVTPFGDSLVVAQLEDLLLGNDFTGVRPERSFDWTDSNANVTVAVRPSGGLEMPIGSYHWRARVLYSSNNTPGPRWSHWFYGGVAGSARGTHVRVTH